MESIKKFLKKASEEVSRKYSTVSSKSGHTAPGQARADEDSLPQLSKGWIGVDLDGTLAYYDNKSSIEKVGPPIPDMLALVKKMINNNIRVKIFTARATDPEQLPIIKKWLKTNNLPELEITNIKDYYMLRLYDDRCIQVERNTGRLINEKNF